MSLEEKVAFDKYNKNITYNKLVSSYIGYGRIVNFQDIKHPVLKKVPIYKLDSSKSDEDSKWFVGEFYFTANCNYSANKFIEVEQEREHEVTKMIEKYTNLSNTMPSFIIVNFLA